MVQEAWGLKAGNQGTLEGMEAYEVNHKHAFVGEGKPTPVVS